MQRQKYGRAGTGTGQHSRNVGGSSTNPRGGGNNYDIPTSYAELLEDDEVGRHEAPRVTGYGRSAPSNRGGISNTGIVPKPRAAAKHFASRFDDTPMESEREHGVVGLPSGIGSTLPSIASRGRSSGTVARYEDYVGGCEIGGGAPVRGGLGTVCRGGTLSRGCKPSSKDTVAILRNEHRVTARGQQVKEDVDNMMDMYYGDDMEVTKGGNAPNIKKGYGQKNGEDSQLLARCTMATDTSQYSKLPIIEICGKNHSWANGPSNQQGRIFDASDRNLLCMDVLGNSAVVGSADHGLKVFDIKTMREKRNLYGKKCGHTEWVTTCAFLKDGRILSGGMDSKLCLWHSSALRCDDLLGHTGSVSSVEVNDHGIGISCAYDRTLRVWDCNTRSELGVMQGHNQPVMSFAWCGNMVMSGDRRGTVKVWDVETCSNAATYCTKGGQIGSLGHLLNQEIGQVSFVGDQGGMVSVFDFRRSGSTPIFSKVLHPGGVVSSLKGMASTGLIVSAGADRRILVLDPRMSYTPLHTFTDHKDFIYSLEVFSNRFVISGGGNGWVLVHDISTGKCCYGLGANTAAVRSIFPSSDHMVCAGDDGKAIVYDY